MIKERRIIITLPSDWGSDQHKNFTAEFSKFLRELYLNWPSVKVTEENKVILK